MRPYLIVGVVAALALASLAFWLEGVGYQRAKVECAIEAGKQSAEIAGLRRQIAEGWRAAGDTIAEQRKELDDAVATVDATPAGDLVCLPAERVRALDAVR